MYGRRLTHRVIDADSAAYYTDIQLSFDGADGFVLLAAEATKLVSVDALFVNILESFPVQITVSVTGNKSIPCVELLIPAISREYMVFTVVLAESKLGSEQSCIAIIDPFETSIVLDVAGLKAGTYIVRVNGVEAEFTLDIDNVAR